MPIDHLDPTGLAGPAFSAARNIGGKPNPGFESRIATSFYYSYSYAVQQLRARFPAGEAAIAMSPAYSKPYSDWLKTIDPEGYDDFQLQYGDWAPSKVAEAAITKARSSDA